MVLATPNSRAMNILLEICKNFATEHYITYSITKTEAMFIRPRGMSEFTLPKLYLGQSEIKYVSSFKYLGHFMSADFTDDSDINRETRNLYIRGNTLIRKFHFLSLDVKLSLFKAYCYSMYTCSLWSTYRQSTINKLRVAYNDIFRKLIGVPREWNIARSLFVNLNTRSFYENIRYASFSLMQRVLSCSNSVVQSLLHSDCFVLSATRATWCDNILHHRQTNWLGFG